MFRQEIVYDKPIYVGTCILHLSKLCMMDFHFDVIHKNFTGRYHLIYWDAHNLYAWAMIQLLAYSNLKFNTTIRIDNILRTADDNMIGYYVEVTLYPKELHD